MPTDLNRRRLAIDVTEDTTTSSVVELLPEKPSRDEPLELLAQGQRRSFFRPLELIVLGSRPQKTEPSKLWFALAFDDLTSRNIDDHRAQSITNQFGGRRN